VKIATHDRSTMAQASWVLVLIAFLFNVIATAAWAITRRSDAWKAKKPPFGGQTLNAANEDTLLPPTGSVSVAQAQVEELEQYIATAEAAGPASSEYPKAAPRRLEKDTMVIYEVTFIVRKALSDATVASGWFNRFGRTRYRYARFEHTIKLAQLDFLKFQQAWPLLHPELNGAHATGPNAGPATYYPNAGVGSAAGPSSVPNI